MGAHSRKVIEMDRFRWLAGLVVGDGYLSDRRVEIYNSSPSILKEVISILLENKVLPERIKIDVYGTDKKTLPKFAELFGLPKQNFRLKKDLSPWKANKQKLRVRVALKPLAVKLHKLIASGFDNYAFVKGLFDAEASVDAKGYIEFKQVASRKGSRVVKTVYRFLKNHGVDCTKPKTKKDAKKNDVYFYVRDLKKFLRKIGFADENKKRLAEALVRIEEKDGQIDETSLMQLLKRPVSLFGIMSAFNCPYHRARKALLKLRRNGFVTFEKQGSTFLYHLDTRQTR